MIDTLDPSGFSTSLMLGFLGLSASILGLELIVSWARRAFEDAAV